METIKVVRNTRAGYAIINKSDFNPARDVLFGAPPAAPVQEWTVRTLREKLGELGVTIPRGASKDDMLALLEGAGS